MNRQATANKWWDPDQDSDFLDCESQEGLPSEGSQKMRILDNLDSGVTPDSLCMYLLPLLSGLILLGGSPSFESNLGSNLGSTVFWLCVTSLSFCCLGCQHADIMVSVLSCYCKLTVQAGKRHSRNGVPFSSLSEPPWLKEAQKEHWAQLFLSGSEAI